LFGSIEASQSYRYCVADNQNKTLMRTVGQSKESRNGRRNNLPTLGHHGRDVDANHDRLSALAQRPVLAGAHTFAPSTSLDFKSVTAQTGKLEVTGNLRLCWPAWMHVVITLVCKKENALHLIWWQVRKTAELRD
jgi:hypothetical protein